MSSYEAQKKLAEKELKYLIRKRSQKNQSKRRHLAGWDEHTTTDDGWKRQRRIRGMQAV